MSTILTCRSPGETLDSSDEVFVVRSTGEVFKDYGYGVVLHLLS